MERNCRQTQDVERPGIAQREDFFGAKILHVVQQLGSRERGPSRALDDLERKLTTTRKARTFQVFTRHTIPRENS